MNHSDIIVALMVKCYLSDLAYFMAKENLESGDQVYLDSHIEMLSCVDFEDLRKRRLHEIMVTLFGDEQWTEKRMAFYKAAESTGKIMNYREESEFLFSCLMEVGEKYVVTKP